MTRHHSPTPACVLYSLQQDALSSASIVFFGYHTWKYHAVYITQSNNQLLYMIDFGNSFSKHKLIMAQYKIQNIQYKM